MQRIKKLGNYGLAIIEKTYVDRRISVKTISRFSMKYSPEQGIALRSALATGPTKLLKTKVIPPFRSVEKSGLRTSAAGNQLLKEVEQGANLPNVKISEDGKTVTIIGESGREDRFNATWLRDHCRCGYCIEPQSGQRRVHPLDLQPHCTLKKVNISDGKLIVKWNDDEHTGILDLSFLAKHTYSKAVREKAIQDTIPLEFKGNVQRFDYKTVTGSDEGLWRWIRNLNEYGICIVDGVPPSVDVKQVAERVGAIKDTVFGEDYIVKMSPDAINLAFTNNAMDTHIDVPYYEAPAGYTVVLCKRFDDCVVGGESIYVDAWREAERLRELYPEHFEVLSRVPVTFRVLHDERSKPEYQIYKRPHFSLDRYTGQISGIFWSSFVQGPLCVDEEDVQPYYEAFVKYAELLDTSETKVTYRLKEGELLALHNRRFVHGRKAYNENGGQRILEICHLCTDSVKSQAQVYSNIYNEGKPVKHVLNQDAF